MSNKNFGGDAMAKLDFKNNGHGRPQKFFQSGGKHRHFVYPFQVADDAMQMNIHKKLCPFYTTKKMPRVTVTVSKMRSLAAIASIFTIISVKTTQASKN